MPETLEPRKKGRLFVSMDQAAAVLGVSKDALKFAKSGGCEAFEPAGRIRELPLLDWFAKNPFKAPAGASLRDQKLSEEIRKLKLVNDERAGVLILKSEVAETQIKFGTLICGLLDQKLENEYPSMGAGLDVAGLRVKGKQLADAIKAEIQKMADVWRC